MCPYGLSAPVGVYGAVYAVGLKRLHILSGVSRWPSAGAAAVLVCAERAGWGRAVGGGRGEDNCIVLFYWGAAWIASTLPYTGLSFVVGRTRAGWVFFRAAARIARSGVVQYFFFFAWMRLLLGWGKCYTGLRCVPLYVV